MQIIFIAYVVLAGLIVLGFVATVIYDWQQSRSKLNQLRQKLARKMSLTIPGKLPIPQVSTMNVGLTRAKTDRQVQPE